ncbi:MAG: hypothetical protein MJK15_05175 [Colwellia sp.]|nr:hypothetical protein [Colwellia sp.]
MADTVKTIGSGGDYADPILWSAAEGNVNDGNRAVGELISDVAINALFRPNQTFPNGGLLRGDTALTGEVGIGRTLTNTAGSRVCLSPNPILEFQDLWISDGGVAKSSTFQNMSGNDFTRVISYDAVTGGTISVIADTTSTTLDNCVFYSIVQGNSSVAGSVTVNNSVIIERMVVRVNNLLTFLNSISLATDWYLGRPTDSGAESLVNYCYIKENANANEFGTGSSNNTLNTDSTSDLVNVALKDYRTGSTSPQATGNGSGGLIGAFLEVSGGVTVTPSTIDSLSVSNNPAITFNSVLSITPNAIDSLSTANNPTVQFNSVVNISPTAINSSSVSNNPIVSFSAVLNITPQAIDSSSSANNPVIVFNNPLNISPATIDSLSVSNNPVIEFKSVINVLPQVVGSLSVSINPFISFGVVQTIGNVTASFKDSGISVKYEEDQITVNFK